MSSCQTRAAMTLAEALVVMTIIAILGSLLLGAIDLAFAARSVQPVCQISAKLALPAMSTQQTTAACCRLRAQTNADSASISWYYRLPNIYDDADVNGHSIWQCPSSTWDGPKIFNHASPKSYKMNGYLEKTHGVGRGVMGGRNSDLVVLFADAVYGETGMGQWGHLARTGLDHDRHGGSCNVVMLDGSTRTIEENDEHDDAIGTPSTPPACSGNGSVDAEHSG